MNSLTLFRLVQGFYWLALGTWFGALVMLAITAAITFRTVREYRPLLTAEPYNQPALIDEMPQIMAGGIVGNVLRGLAVVQIVCAAVAGGCIVLQCTVFAGQLRGGPTGLTNMLRVAFVAMPILVLCVDQMWITPRIWDLRKTMYDVRESVHVREETRTQFDRMHHLDERIVSAAAWFLLAAILASAFAFEVGAGPKAATPAARVPAATDRESVPPT